jgi:hypothetical protein
MLSACSAHGARCEPRSRRRPQNCGDRNGKRLQHDSDCRDDGTARRPDRLAGKSHKSSSRRVVARDGDILIDVANETVFSALTLKSYA